MGAHMTQPSDPMPGNNSMPPMQNTQGHGGLITPAPGPGSNMPAGVQGSGPPPHVPQMRGPPGNAMPLMQTGLGGPATPLPSQRITHEPGGALINSQGGPGPGGAVPPLQGGPGNNPMPSLQGGPGPGSLGNPAPGSSNAQSYLTDPGLQLPPGSGNALMGNTILQNMGSTPQNTVPLVGMLGGLPLHGSPHGQTATIFVEGIPADCKDREAAHIFRAFEGFRGMRLCMRKNRVNMTLCFVEYETAGHAQVAIERLNGYVFDPKADPGALPLKAQMSHSKTLLPKGRRSNGGSGRGRGR